MNNKSEKTTSFKEETFVFYDKIKRDKKQPLWYKNFWVILLVELIGTFLLVLGIILPDVLNFADSSAHSSTAFWHVVEGLYEPYILKAAWVAFVIFILVIPAIRISANFNPAVTIVEIGKGNDSLKLGISKIAIQFIGAFCAAFVGLAIANSLNLKTTLDAIKPTWNHFDFKTNEIYASQTFYNFKDSWFWFIQVIMEFILTFALISSVFWFGKKTKLQRTGVICGMVILIVTIGIRTSDVGLNPARTFAPSFVMDITKKSATLNNGQPFYLSLFSLLIITSQVLAAFAFIYLDKKRTQFKKEYIQYTTKQINQENNNSQIYMGSREIELLFQEEEDFFDNLSQVKLDNFSEHEIEIEEIIEELNFEDTIDNKKRK